MRIAIQMDRIDSINIKGDTTFALMLEAQKRGYDLHYYTPDSISLHQNDVVATTHPIKVRDIVGDYHSLTNAAPTSLSSFDVILMRQDPPFDMNYLTYTYLLEQLPTSTLVLNNPKEVRNCPEKLFACHFARFMPPTLITSSLMMLSDFLNVHQQIVLKPLYGYGGNGIISLCASDANTESALAKYLSQAHEPIMAQAFLENVSKGDKRILLIDGEVAAAINRVPAEGNILSNLVQGGHAEATVLTERETEICLALSPELKQRDLLLVGIDVIDGYLTEINVTSPTGIRAADALYNTNLANDFWDAVERKINHRNYAK